MRELFGALAGIGVLCWSAMLSLAQATGGEAAPTFITLVVQLGLSGVFLWQWRAADSERRDLSERMVEMLEQMLPALKASTDALERVQQGLTRQVERVPSEVDETVRTLRKAVEDANAALRSASDPSGNPRTR